MSTASIRITNELRENIITIEANKKFDKIIKDHESALLSHFEEVVKKRTPEFDPDLIKNNWIATSSHIKITFDKNAKYPNNREESFHIKNAYATKTSWYNSHKIEPTEKILKLKANIDLAKEEKKIFSENLRTLLYSFNTSKHLIENVPELAVHFKGMKPKTGQLVPMKLVEQMRGLLVDKSQVIQ